MHKHKQPPPLPQTAYDAKQLLQGEVMQEVWEVAEGRFIAEWKDADTVERREIAHAKVMGIAEVRRALRAILQNGEHGSRA